MYLSFSKLSMSREFSSLSTILFLLRTSHLTKRQHHTTSSISHPIRYYGLVLDPSRCSLATGQPDFTLSLSLILPPLHFFCHHSGSHLSCLDYSCSLLTGLLFSQTCLYTASHLVCLECKSRLIIPHLLSAIKCKMNVPSFILE